jgi:16S rRNA U516 pseudouridylate synthase RsuA-like enzyme
VKRLQRVRFANLRLGGLKPGQWRLLSAREIESLLQVAGVSEKTAPEYRRR